MFKKVLLSLAFCLVVAPFAFAQSGTLSGVITDARTGEELPGVNVFIQDVGLGAATNIDGEYTISGVPYGTYTVRVTYIGYGTVRETVEIDQPTQTLDLSISEDLVGLDEMIVTGQGTGVERGRLSTSVGTISAKRMEQLPTVQLDQLLQANIGNSQVNISSGMPGSAPLIRGRGINSALASTNPVIYVDGVRVDNTNAFSLNRETGGAQSSAIADIPIENIERIEVVSGGAATTQFGSDAANGVIQIFTKQGVEGQTQFTFNSNMGASVGQTQFLRYDETADILFSPGLLQEYRLTGSGGTSDYTYSFSGSMRGQEGVVPQTDQVRHNLRASLNARVTDWLRYNSSFGFTSSEFERGINANFAGGLLDIETGDMGNPEEWDDETFQSRQEFIRGYVDLMDITEDVKRFQTSHALNFDIQENLSAKAVVGLDFRNSEQLFIETNQYIIARGFAPEGTMDQGNMDQTNRSFLGLTLEGSARHDYEVGDFSFITNVGGQLFRNHDVQLRVGADELPDGSRNVGSAAETNGFNFERTVVNYGVYVLENIGYRDRYFVEFGLRGDENTAFGEEVGIQWYPKVGAVYNIHREPFFSELVPGNLISTLRVRTNLGWAGNFPTPFSNEVLASVNPFQGAKTIEFGTPGDVNLKPEKTRTFEVGGDIAFIQDRFNLEFTYYQSETTDALFSAPFARSYGLTTSLQNIGVIENSGIEIAGNFNVLRTRDANVGIRASFNTLNNEVVDNGGTAPFVVGGFTFLGSWVDEGQPVGYLRGNRPIFDDAGNMVDVVPNDNLGKPSPDYFGNFGIDAEFRNWSFTATADYQMGAQGVYLDEVLRFFSGLGDDRIPEAALGESFFDLAGVWVEDADFVKVRLLSARYTVPRRLYSDVLRGVTVGATVTNPFSWTASNFDPEITGQGISRGQDGLGVGGFPYSSISTPRQIYGSLRVDF